MISVEKLFYSYGDGTRVLTDFSLHVEQGEFVAVVGRSGAGKSTLLHVLGGLDSHFTGDVRVAGQALAGRSDAQLARFRSETVGFVFQFFHLVPGLSALENVLLPSAFGGVRDEGKARAALVRVGLEGKEARLPGQLSGGERQRVAIARALFNEPRVLLCDEPTGNLDVQTAQEVIELFRKLNAEGLTIVAVTHEAQLREAASRVVDMVGAAAGAMNRAPGTVVSPTTPAGAQEATAGTAGADHTTPGVGARFIAPGVRTGTHGLSFSALRRLVSLQLRRDKRAALTSAFGVAVGIGALVFFVALGLGVGRVVRDKVFPVDASLIEVVPSQLSLGMFGGKLDQSAVDRLAAMEGVKAAHRKQLVKVPAVSFYNGDFFGRRLRIGFEVLAVGVDESLVKADVEGAFTDRGADEPVPAVAATRLLEIYNKTFAPARGLPQLSGTMLVGFRFPIDWNRSFVAQGKGGQQSGTAEVVGVSERGLLAGITIPLAAAQRLNAQFNEDNTVFSGVTLEAESPAQVPALLKAVEAMGLRVDDRERQLAESAGAAVTLTTAAMGLLSALICLLAAFNIAHALSAATRAREKELGVMRAVGARRVDLFKLVLAEALLLGALGGAAGALAAFGLAHGLDAVSAKMLPDFPFKPDSFFLFPAALIPSGVLGGALAALAGAWWPARRASRVDPSRVLSGQG